MSGNGTPNGPSNPASLVTENIVAGTNVQSDILQSTYQGMDPDPGPTQIHRLVRARNAGTIGEGQLDAAWPDDDRRYIPHQYIPRRPISVTPFDKTIDVTVTIPAVFVGDPLH